MYAVIQASYLQPHQLGTFRASVITNSHVLQLSWLHVAAWPTHQAPQSLIKWGQFLLPPVRNTHFDSCLRVVPHPKTPGVIYFLPPYKMQSTPFSCSCCIIHSLGMTTPLRNYPKIIPKESYCWEGHTNKMLHHTETCCSVPTVKGHPSKKKKLQSISPKRLGHGLHHGLGSSVVYTETPLNVEKSRNNIACAHVAITNSFQDPNWYCMATRAIEVRRRSMLLGTMAASNNRAVHLELLCNQLGETLTQGTTIQPLKLPWDLLWEEAKRLLLSSPGDQNIFRFPPIKECLPLLVFINTNILH